MHNWVCKALYQLVGSDQQQHVLLGDMVEGQWNTPDA
jgi:hypothetical protein